MQNISRLAREQAFEFFRGLATEAISKAPRPPSERAARLRRLVESVGGCQVGPLRELVAELTGEDLSGPGGNKYAPGTILVPTSNSNSHSYPLNEPIMYVGGGRAIGRRGLGNIIVDGDVRVATPEERRDFESRGREILEAMDLASIGLAIDLATEAMEKQQG